MANIIENTLTSIGDQKTYLFCDKHFYTPSKVSKPTSGCANCWRALYLTIYAKQKTEDDKREFVDGLESAIRHFAEQLDGGTWDFVPHKPLVSVEHIDDDVYDPEVHLQTKEEN